jgi:hypothetical protein
MIHSIASFFILEAALTLLFFAVLLGLRRRIPPFDAALWVIVWATRTFAAINGCRHIPSSSAELTVYMGLQACSALALLLTLSRAELRVWRQKVLRRLTVEVYRDQTRSVNGET